MNGWKNYKTWNVALWVNNDEVIYRLAVSFMDNFDGRSPYESFIHYAGLCGETTPDGIDYLDKDLSYKELNSMMYDLL